MATLADNTVDFTAGSTFASGTRPHWRSTGVCGCETALQGHGLSRCSELKLLTLHCKFSGFLVPSEPTSCQRFSF